MNTVYTRVVVRGKVARHTHSVVEEIGELVPPLSHYAERVFEKGYDDKETANCWEVTAEDAN